MDRLGSVYVYISLRYLVMVVTLMSTLVGISGVGVGHGLFCCKVVLFCGFWKFGRDSCGNHSKNVIAMALMRMVS